MPAPTQRSGADINGRGRPIAATIRRGRRVGAIMNRPKAQAAEIPGRAMCQVAHGLQVVRGHGLQLFVLSGGFKARVSFSEIYLLEAEHSLVHVNSCNFELPIEQGDASLMRGLLDSNRPAA